VREVLLAAAGANAKNSTSLRRAPGPKEELRGSSSNVPFWPGGFDEDEDEDESQQGSLIDYHVDVLRELDDRANFWTCPPGFERGIDFNKSQNEQRKVAAGADVVDLTAALANEDDLGLWKDEEEPLKNTAERTSDVPLSEASANDDDLPADTGVPVLATAQTAAAAKTADWAEAVDISKPMLDFRKRVPVLAHDWPFELDEFQKAAVVRLERGESVFVAAHTSAGKTVVAEYAIALSQKHMTRTIYTSPIKALSNQKFRDFKDTFNDVGLVTGDIQINANATCLIMTTEILRSMLYGGSDIIRDLEYVIFDEVHYINDEDRGVVWEEVLILLPDHVNIIMLSATVPNTLEFADWVGRTKKKKIHVISTAKRPVPLEHFLYTGSNAKTRDDRFLLQVRLDT